MEVSLRIFVAYKSDDRRTVGDVVNVLEALGHEVFWDQQIPGSDLWRTTIHREILASDVVVLCWSRNTEDASAANWLLDEADEARRLGKRLVPVRLNPCQVPLGFRQLQTVDIELSAGDRFARRMQQALAGELSSAPGGSRSQLPASIAKKLFDYWAEGGRSIAEAKSVAVSAERAAERAEVTADRAGPDGKRERQIEWDERAYAGEVSGGWASGWKPHGYGVMVIAESFFNGAPDEYGDWHVAGLFENGSPKLARTIMQHENVRRIMFSEHDESGQPEGPVVWEITVITGEGQSEKILYFGESTNSKPFGHGALVMPGIDLQLVGFFNFELNEWPPTLDGWYIRCDADGNYQDVVKYDEDEIVQNVSVSLEELRSLAASAL